MADRSLRIITTFNDEGALTGLRVLNQEIGKTDDAGKKGKSGLLGFGTGLSDTVTKMAEFTAAAALVGAGLKQVYDQAKEGANLELANQRFENLTRSIGTTSDAMLNQLGAASGGMVSNAEMISNASQIISLGLADNQADVVDLATLVSQLGWDMNQVIMTFANNSRMRLDALGLSVQDVEQKAAALEKQGYSMDKAFDLAVIQAGKEKLQLLGSAADSDVGSIDRMEASIQNLSDAVKTRLAPVFGDAAEAIYYFLEGQNLVVNTLVAHEAEVEASSTSWAAYAEEQIRAAEASGKLSAALAEQARTEANASGTLYVLTNALLGQGIAIDYTDRKTWNLGQTTVSIADQMEALYGQIDAATLGWHKNANAVDTVKAKELALREEQARLKAAMSDLQLFIQGPLGEEYDNFTQKNADLEAQAAALREEITKLGGTEYLTADQTTQISTLQGELNNVALQIVALDDQIKSGELGTNKQYAAEQNLEDLRTKAWELEQQIETLGGKPYVTSKNLEDINAAKAKLGEVNQALAENAAAHDEATRRIIFDLMAQRAAMDGLTDGEMTILNDLALQWGLIDQATYDAVNTIDQAFTDLANGESITEVENQIRGIDDALVTSNENMGEKGVGAMNDYKNKMLELVEPMTENATLITTTADAAKTLNDKLNAAAGTYDIRFNITTNGSIPDIGYNHNPGSANNTQGQSSTTAAALEGNDATGIENYVVPPGYPNDSYRVGLTSGEVYSVHTPAQQLRQAFGSVNDRGGVQIGTLNIYQQPGEDAEALAQRVAQILQEHNR